MRGRILNLLLFFIFFPPHHFGGLETQLTLLQLSDLLLWTKFLIAWHLQSLY